MSDPRVVTLAPMPPEKAAYALARYSRSADGIADSLRWVFDHSAEKFWEQFYYQYGHGSIADLGHVVVCFEGVSELAAIAIEDEKVWDGQAKSSRYQDFAAGGFVVPSEVAGSPEAEAHYRSAADALLAAYRKILEPMEADLRERNPRPDEMKEAAYGRTIQARAFDVARYLLPLGVPTNVGQVVSIRTLEKQIGHLYASPQAEVRELAAELQAACSEKPLDVWGELSGAKVEGEALAPTLARYARPNEYWQRVYAEVAEFAGEWLELGSVEAAERVELVEEAPVEVEIAATLLYRVSRYPYRQVLAAVREWPEARRRELLDLAARDRGFEELVPEFQAGHRFTFDVLMDVGGWRDMHRHRRCEQVRQGIGFEHGYEVPAGLAEAGLGGAYDDAMQAARDSAAELPESARPYLVPFGYRMRCLFKMDYAEIEYVSKLRSGVKGHLSYRQVAWDMKQALAAREPYLAERIDATPPWVEDTLRR